MLDSRSSRRPLVWIVDDSPTEAKITERSLGEAYDFEYFQDGSVVVERFSATPRLPDLLLLDWVMPGMHGDEVCRFLRSRAETRELPIIMVTATRVDVDDIVTGLATGANDYVPRPFAPQELRARVDAALRTKQLSDLATHERERLTTVNQLSRALFQSTTSPQTMLDELAGALTVSLCDGCAVLILPGPLPALGVSRHRHDPGGAALAKIASVADPVIHAFSSAAHAKAILPPAYADYIERFGLRGIAILPFPIRDPIRGIVTVTREGDAEPFDAEDIATIETCIEHASLAIERVLRFDAERIARAQLDTVLESLPVGILATDATGELGLVNSSARELVPGIDGVHALEDVFRLHGWAAADGAPIDAAALLGPHLQLPINVELRLNVGADQHVIAVSAVPLRDGAGAITGSVTVLQDVSAERAITTERERVAKFQEEMVGIVGHDLRNPLSAIYTGAQLLAEQTSELPILHRTVRRLQNSTIRMRRIIEQLLDVTHVRLGSGIPIARRDMQLTPLATGVVDELSVVYPQARFEIQAPGEIDGTWDPDRLGQVISNLASNAAQYAAPDQPITVELAEAGDDVVISVRNAIRDAPIDPATLAVLFEPFRRGKAQGHATGLGLGLYIVHAIITAHRGTIAVESTAAGTVFRVVLPRS